MTSVLEREPGVYWQEAEQAWDVVPKHLGPTWQENPLWDRVNEAEKFVLPEFTLGWQVLAWITENLYGDEVDEWGERKPFIPTAEQSRFILWWYAIDLTGRFAFRQGVLQRLKGWGKDPLVAVLAFVELVGPCRFGGWAVEDMPEIGVLMGDPVAVDNPRAWIQIAAVSKEQTVNTSALFPGIFRPELKEKCGLDIGKEIIYAYGGQRRIQCVTSSPKALEGARPTFVIMNETHHWLKNNEGHQMFKVITRNVTKSKGGAARILAITNAYDPSEDSVAQRRRESYEEQLAGLAYDSRVLYDSIEAPPDAKIRPRKLLKDSPDPTEEQIKTYLAAVVTAVRGDATWLDLETILAEIMDTNNPAGESRRFYFNQIIASEDSWVDPAAIEAAIDKVVAHARRTPGVDDMKAGWIPMPHEPIVAFFDGSKSGDSTALVGCRIEDGYCFTIGVWTPPTQKDRAKTWLAPRGLVDSRVDEMFTRFNVVGFWADPSHATDDDAEGSSYWDATIDDWMKRHGRKLDKKVWPVKSGLGVHAVAFDMSSPTNQKAFVGMAEQTVEDFERLNDIEEFDPTFRIDGHPALVQHLRNARSNPSNKWGISLMKENRMSKHKIDLAVCLVGARLLRKLYINTEDEEDPYSDGAEVWGF